MVTSQDSSAASPAQKPRISVLEIARVLVLLVALFSFVVWGLLSWAAPWNIVVAVATPAIVLLVWALFLSPRPVLRVHPFIAAAVELLIYAGVTIAWWSLGEVIAGIGFALVSVTAGVMAGLRRLA